MTWTYYVIQLGLPSRDRHGYDWLPLEGEPRYHDPVEAREKFAAACRQRRCRLRLVQVALTVLTEQDGVQN